MLSGRKIAIIVPKARNSCGLREKVASFKVYATLRRISFGKGYLVGTKFDGVSEFIH